ncbi:hypothetical protein KUL156_06510 [Alteromonas sp. KUL156]|nr:hypothetical protein KUL154_46390 [Alteromonas sp. KUL154]GFD98058.1 hypothetical protein KUL156_06510 [Alteromonas sp. KUL156]
MNNSNLQQLNALCLQIHKEGKPLSVGILRAKAPFKVSVTEAIEAVKRFNAHKPSIDKQRDNGSEKRNVDLPLSRGDLYARIDSLEKEVAELKQVLHKLLSDIK